MVTATKAPTVTPAPLPPVTYEDTAVGTGPNQFNFQGNTPWTVDTNPQYSGGTDHYTNDTSDFVTFTFTGTRIQFVSAKNNNLGFVGVTLNGSEKDIDCYDPNLIFKATVYDSGSLARGTYTIKIFPTGQKNSSSVDFYVAVDALIVTP